MRVPVRGWKALLSVALLMPLICSCASKEAEPPPTATPPYSAAPLPRSFKGYELYSWRSGGTWYFTLITGTNRLKTLAEITSPENVEEGDWVKITAVGVPALKSVLARLPAGTQISWVSARHLDSGGRESGPRIRRPPVWVFRELESYCSGRDLDLGKGH
jgi:hypothetical protein